MNITIREAGVEDVPRILHHRVRMFEDMGKGSSEALIATTGAFLKDAMPRGRYRGWLAVTGEDRVVAGAGVTIVDWPGSPDDPAPRRGWIQNVYTEPEFRRKGVARRLMQAAIEWCGQAGFVHISLHASVYGRALYEELGFAPTNEMRLLLKK